ncbi:MAG: sugar phosphate isomerase/epimerase [Clostridia bacterium]|nr:sugar phosphate isomerase/epimerase [Clostridia bacterium]
MKTPRIFAFADEASPMIDGQIAALLRNGMQGLEIRNVDGENISSISLEKAKEVRAKLDGHGLIVWSLGSPIGKTDIEQENMDAVLHSLRHSLDIARILGAGNIRMFSFYIPAGKDPADYRGKVIDRLGRMTEAARDSGVALCHENEKGIYGDNAARCLDLLSEVKELCGVFDPANFIQCGQDTWEAWELLHGRIKYLHVKDALFADGSVVPAGKGEGQVGKILDAFLRQGGSEMTVEPHLQVFDGLKQLERKGEESLIGGHYAYPNSDAAFDAAGSALKELLSKIQ